MIIGVLQQKGGVGKTTIALNLAGCFAAAGKRVLLVDADPQGSAMAWSSVRERTPLFSVIGMPKPTLHKELPAIARDYDITLIDGAPRVNDLARSAILACDTILIPVQPSPFDIWSCVEIVTLVTEAQQYRPAITAAFVVNRKIANTAIARDVLKAFADFPFPLLDVALTQRVGLAEAASEGLTIVETAPGSRSAHEFEELAEALLSTHTKRIAA